MNSGKPSRDTGWTAQELDFVRGLQEREFLELADSLGCGFEEARDRFETPKPPIEIMLPSKFEGIWDSVPGSIEEKDAAVTALYDRYFLKSAPSDLEDAIRYAAAQMMMDNTVARLSALGQISVEPPLVATLPCNSTEATILQPPGARRHIVFYSDGLFLYLGDIAKFIATCLQPMDNQQFSSDRLFARSLSLAPVGPLEQERFAQMIDAYVVRSAPRDAQRIKVSPESYWLGIHLFNQLQMFVLAHEIGHLELGHTVNHRFDESGLHESEHEADLFAMRALCEISSQELGSWAVGYWGCQVALLSFDILNNSLKILDRRKPDAPWVSRTHPSIVKRRRVLQAEAERIAQSDALKAAVHATNLTCQLFNWLWDDTRFKLLLFIGMDKTACASPTWDSYIRQHFGARSA